MNVGLHEDAGLPLEGAIDGAAIAAEVVALVTDFVLAIEVAISAMGSVAGAVGLASGLKGPGIGVAGAVVAAFCAFCHTITARALAVGVVCCAAAFGAAAIVVLALGDGSVGARHVAGVCGALQAVSSACLRVVAVGWAVAVAGL